MNLFVAAAHCIKAQRLIRDKEEPTYIRLGEHDLRTDRDCENVSDCYLTIF